MYMYLLLNVWCFSIRAGPLGYGRSCTCLIRVGDTYYTSGKNYCALRGFIGSICNLGSGLEHGKHFIFLHRNVLISKGCCCEIISFCWNERNWVFVNDFFYCALCGFLLQIKQKKISSKFFNFSQNLATILCKSHLLFAVKQFLLNIYAVLCVLFILKLIHFRNFKQLMIYNLQHMYRICYF